jgi:hypothetical protein
LGGGLGGGGGGGVGWGGGAGGEMNQALYAHMNNERKNKKINVHSHSLEQEMPHIIA